MEKVEQKSFDKSIRVLQSWDDIFKRIELGEFNKELKLLGYRKVREGELDISFANDPDDSNEIYIEYKDKTKDSLYIGDTIYIKDEE